MPIVPEQKNFNVMPNVASGGNFELGTSPEQATIGARETIAEGQNIQQAGTQLANVQIEALDQANQLRVDDALNQVKETSLKLTYDPKDGYTNVKGIDALQRASGKSLSDDYGDILQGKIDATAATLSNDAQKTAFMTHAKGMLVNFKGDATQHEGQEFQTYGLSVRDGTIKNRQNEIALNYNNPAAVDEAVTSIKAATYDQARMLGKSADWAEAQSREATSKAHALAISTALQKNDTTFADMYMKKYAKDMEADDILAVNGNLTKQLNGQIGLNTATSVIQTYAPKITTSDSDRAFNIALGAESGGKQIGGAGSVAGPNEPTTSTAGAIGVAQVLPETGKEVAAANNIPWDEDKFKNDAAYNSQIGKLYFTQQLKDFNGNLSAAYAAYNAGPGADSKTGLDSKGQPLPGVKPAMTRAAAKGTPENWLAELPDETQNYVSKNMKAFGNGSGQFEKPTLVDIQNSIREKIGPNQPERLKIALDEGERQYNDMNAAVKQQSEEAKANAMRGVMNNGGRFTDLPADVRGAVKPEDVSSVMDFAKKIAAGDDTTSLLLYQKLSADPGTLKNMSDDQFFALRSELSESDFKHFADQRGALITGTTQNGPDNLNNDAIKRTLDDRMMSMGFDPNPKDRTSAQAQQMGAVRQFVNQNIMAEQANRGKKMSDAEVSSFIDQVFATQVPNGVGFFSGQPMSRPLITSTVDDIPTATSDALKAAFKRQGIDTPSNSDLLNAYLNQVSMIAKMKAKAKTSGG